MLSRQNEAGWQITVIAAFCVDYLTMSTSCAKVKPASAAAIRYCLDLIISNQMQMTEKGQFFRNCPLSRNWINNLIIDHNLGRPQQAVVQLVAALQNFGYSSGPNFGIGFETYCLVVLRIEILADFANC